MKPEHFPKEIQAHLIPEQNGKLIYRCLGCGAEHSIEKLLYTCPGCGAVLLIYDENFDRLKEIPGETWHQIFDYRKMLTIPALKGIYRYHEFIGPVIPTDAIVYLGEGHTPVVEGNGIMQEKAGLRFYFKNDGQNPSASFKDRGMASALSYINYLVKSGMISDVLAICASTGDTSAAAALYAAYLKPHIKSAVLLPHKKVTPQQLGQPLGSGASVFEIPGVFDDCMKVVEHLADNYNVALLNSKNAWRILGQESYSYEVAQDFEYDMADKVVVVPIGNAGNITAVMSGFLKFYETGIISALPKVIGVQSEHANPVYKYYLEPDPAKREFVPMTVSPSVAQAAMIGNPVSMPRVIRLAEQYNRTAGGQRVFFISVTEQEIMDWELTANRNGHIACTHGGESLAGLVRALKLGYVDKDDVAVVDSTAHALKFAGFQQMYFENSFPPEFGVTPKPELVNAPTLMRPADLERVPEPGNPLGEADFKKFVRRVSDEIAATLKLTSLK
ncbi:threonine synthase [Desulfonema ishimotonii]|uniref:Threonine synthase n=1 Tax=Desulfonema ishimotonii TaxID=45657 RepID=A0A401G3C1_9BACT|nr:threonine synthase [Desulfonema ishimotonii]GBC63706.1 threonine synthase [Desulfonema ishimotonii]